MRINFDAGSMFALLQINRTEPLIQRSMDRLSSGKRIASFRDDPAGFIMADNLYRQARSAQSAQQASQYGSTLANVADAGLDQIQSHLQRVRDLAVQWNSGLLDDAGKAAITSEVTQLSTDIARITANTEVNGTSLLTGSAAVATLQVGSAAADVIQILGVDAAAAVGTSVSNFAAAAPGATIDINAIDASITAISSGRGQMGAMASRLEAAYSFSATSEANLMEAHSRIMDVDVGKEMANLTSLQIRRDMATAMLAQANTSRRNVLGLLGIN